MNTPKSNRPQAGPRENQEPARIWQEPSAPDDGLNRNPRSEPMKIFGPRAISLGLLAVILPVGFALAQGGAVPSPGAAAAPNGMPGLGAPPSTGAAPPPPITGQSAPPAPSAVQGIAE